jgi:predicted ATPase
LVGREAALAEVEDAWVAAEAGARQVALVGGEAGSGKSRLAAEIAAVLHGIGATVLIGQCVADLGQPYQPFVEPLAVLLDIGVAGDPGIADALRALTGPELDPAATRQTFQRQLYAAVVTVVKAVCGHGPALLVLEDLQWSGAAGQDLLSYLVRHTADCRLLIVATYRDAASDRLPALVDALARLQSLAGVRRIRLNPLGTEDIALLLEQDAGLPSATAVTVAAELRDQTGGNAYFVRELLRDRGTRGDLRVPGQPLVTPPSVRDALQSRMSRLRPEDAGIAGLVAIIGEEAELAILCGAAERPAPEVMAALDACAGAGVLRPLGDGDDTVLFAHALARQAILDLLPAAVRMGHHARVAAEIERRPATRRRVQRLAHHYVGAHPLGYTDQAIRYLTEAAGMAAAGLAHRDAARLYERVAALQTRPDRRDAALLEAVQQLIHAGDFARARELAEQVAATGTAAQQLHAAIAFEAASWRPGLPGYRAADLLGQALARTAQDLASSDYIRGRAVLGRALTFTAEPSPASAHFVTAIDLARGSGDVDLLMEALSASLWERRRPVGVSRSSAAAAAAGSALFTAKTSSTGCPSLPSSGS